MRTLKTIPGSVLIQHVMESTLPHTEKVLLTTEINSLEQYTISRDITSSVVRGYSRKCQIEKYLSASDKRFISSECKLDNHCYYSNCVYKDTQKRSKCVAITNFKQYVKIPTANKISDAVGDTVPSQRVIPGEALNSNFKNRFFVYQKQCRDKICNHIFLEANLQQVLHYFSKEDLMDIAAGHNMFPPQIAFNYIHKSALLQRFFQHQCTKDCKRLLHFVEVFNDM